jgi:dethiobiotin synthase
VRGLFITGTGTGVGKTVVVAGLLRLLRGGADAIDIVPMKPVQTGCMRGEDGALRAPDLEYVLIAAGFAPDDRERALMCPYRFAPACSPDLAGRLSGTPVELDRIECCARELVAGHDALIVEGAGGALAPLNDTATMRDLMTRLALPVVVVADAGLGTINHTLLTLEALRAARLTVLGVILNDGERADDGADADAIGEDNPATIARLGDVAILGGIPRLGDLGSPGGVADPRSWAAFDAAMRDIDPLLAAIHSRLS